MTKKILIVDDSHLMVSVISNFIKKERTDVELITAESGEEAVEKYISEKPNLVFMDIKMNGIDGIEALKQIKSKDSSAKVVMCTSLKETEQEEQATKAGCVGYILKPFSKQDISEQVNKYV